MISQWETRTSMALLPWSTVKKNVELTNRTIKAFWSDKLKCYNWFTMVDKYWSTWYYKSIYFTLCLSILYCLKHILYDHNLVCRKLLIKVSQAHFWTGKTVFVNLLMTTTQQSKYYVITVWYRIETDELFTNLHV